MKNSPGHHQSQIHHDTWSHGVNYACLQNKFYTNTAVLILCRRVTIRCEIRLCKPSKTATSVIQADAKHAVCIGSVLHVAHLNHFLVHCVCSGHAVFFWWPLKNSTALCERWRGGWMRSCVDQEGKLSKPENVFQAFSEGFKGFYKLLAYFKVVLIVTHLPSQICIFKEAVYPHPEVRSAQWDK